MDKLLQQIKENRVVNILLNPKGTLSRKEYWFAMLMLLLLFTVPISSIQNVYKLINFISTNIPYNGGLDQVNNLYIVSNMLSSLNFLPLLPYTFIVLYSSFIITFKRARGHFNNPVKWLLGVFTYFIPISIGMLQNFINYEYMRSEGSLINTQLIIMICLFMGLGIISFIILSCLPSTDKESDYDNKYGSINFTFKLMGVSLLYGILLGLIYIWIISKSIFGAYSSTGQLPLFAISLAYLGTFIFLIIKRSQDAKLPVYIPLIILISVIIITSATMLLFALEIVKQVTFAVTLIPTFFFMLTAVFNALFFIFIALPTKAPKDEVYW